jgi:hypothetical protein
MGGWYFFSACQSVMFITLRKQAAIQVGIRLMGGVWADPLLELLVDCLPMTL